MAKESEANGRLMGKTFGGGLAFMEALYMALHGPPMWEGSLAWGTSSPLVGQVDEDRANYRQSLGLTTGHRLSPSISPETIFFSVSPSLLLVLPSAFFFSFLPLLLLLKTGLHLLTLSYGHFSTWRLRANLT